MPTREELESLLPPVITTKDLCAFLGVGRIAIYRKIQAGYLPPPSNLAGSTRWFRNDLVAHLLKTSATHEVLASGVDAKIATAGGAWPDLVGSGDLDEGGPRHGR